MSMVAEGGCSFLCSSSTVLLRGQLTHVVYTAQGKELMLLAVPDNRLVTLYALHKAKLFFYLLFCICVKFFLSPHKKNIDEGV
jgi:hypothetical protein